MGITVKAGYPVTMDEFAAKFRKTLFARVRVELNSSEPLKPGALIRGYQRVFWQSFIYENIPSIYYQCWSFGPYVLEECQTSREEGRSGGHPLQLANLC